MTEIPDSMKDAAFLDGMWGQITNMEQREKFIASALLAAEKRGEERERERLANMSDPEVGLPSDRLLRVIHADVETRGRKNNKFAVTVHHRNIVLSAVAAAIRKGSD